ncbi:MAG TPA: ABC transporter ATP-binding protein [Steroidobacteraceae bacterium]|nr:ABC transporter ATP-binding protein [Steroidobacteraceae bacterium]
MFRYFENLVSPYPDGPPPPLPQGFFAFLWACAHGLRRYIVGMTFFTALIGVFEALLFSMLGRVVDWLSHVRPADLWTQERGHLLLLAGILGGSVVLVGAQTFIKHQTLAGNFAMRLRWNFHRNMLAQSMSFYQDEFAGRVAAKLMQTSLAVRDTWMLLADIMVFVSIYFVTMTLVVGTFSPSLLLPFLGWLAVYLLTTYYFVPRLGKVAREQADARSMMTGRITDAYTNITTVKLFSHTQREAGYVQTAMAEFLGTVYRQMRMVTGFEIVNHALSMLLIAGTAGATLLLWTRGQIGIGAVAAATAMALRLNGISHWVMWEMASLFEQVGTVQDGINTLARSPTIVDAPDAQPLRVTRGEIRFEHVTFAYAASAAPPPRARPAGAPAAGAAPPVAGAAGASGAAAPAAGAPASNVHALQPPAKPVMPTVIDDLNLVIRPGEKIGLVGRSGAGKSTIVNLLLRFYDIPHGRVLIDGQDIARVTQDSLRAQIGMVTQDTSLLHRSVSDNIRYGRPSASDAEMVAAAKRAEAHEFIQTLGDAFGRMGYDAHVGERGVKLSGGQRQRVAIARVMLKDAPILLLDEATSALDSEVEAAIQQSLYRLMEGKTVVAIAHRLSTIAAMDRLIVLDRGRVVEEGTHYSLLAAGGLYARLWAHQSGGFLGEEAEETPLRRHASAATFSPS